MSRAFVVAANAVLISAAAAVAQSTYYVSPTGNDNADGLTPATAWASLNKVDSTTFAPGSNILFQAGGTWRGQQLLASSSGTVAQPITYASYGTGANPTFVGSEVLNKSGFAQVGGTSSTYSMTTDRPIYSVLGSGDFLHSSALVTGGSSTATNVAYVNANPNSWYYDDATKKLYVNTGGAIGSDPRQITGVVQDDLVYNNKQSNIVFKNLTTDESAKAGAGYGFRVEGGSNVQIVDGTALRAGKHNFGVIDSTGFVGNGITAAYAMPDQGLGGATALVSYSDANYHQTTSSWNNVSVSNMGTQYPAFYNHTEGDGLGPVVLSNFRTDGAGINTTGNVTLTNITANNAGIDLEGGSTLTGATLTGAGGVLKLGQNVTAKNVLIKDYVNDYSSYPTPIVVTGSNATLELSTVTISKAVNQNVSLFEILAGSSLNLFGNIFDGSKSTMVSYYDSLNGSNTTSDYNVWAGTGSGVALTLLQAMGLDAHSLGAMPTFVDAGNGNYALAPGSIGIDAIPDSLLSQLGLTDINGVLRPQGKGIDIGAFEFAVAVPEPTALAVVVPAGAMLLGRRRRGR